MLVSVAFVTVIERKYLSGVQRRKGPNVVGAYGLLQAIGDGVKLVVKETTRPSNSEKSLFMV